MICKALPTPAIATAPRPATSRVSTIPSSVSKQFSPITGAANPAIRRILWYGFPRDVGGPISAANPGGGADGVIQGYTGGATVDGLVDVVPVRDLAMIFNPNYFTATNALAFERHIAPDTADGNRTLQPRANYATGLTAADHYTCVWGPSDTNRPRMIRIIATVDDANGRLGNGQTYEYVINLP